MSNASVTIILEGNNFSLDVNGGTITCIGLCQKAMTMLLARESLPQKEIEEEEK